MKDFINKINAHHDALSRLKDDLELQETLHDLIDKIVLALSKDNKLMICGNGGSAADAQHMAAEFIGRFAFDSRPLPALTLTSDTSTITCIANDYKFEDIFKRQIEGLGREGDIILGISTSGASENILRALEKARDMNITTAILTSTKANLEKLICNYAIKVEASNTATIQEMHLIIEHYICEQVELRLCG